MPAGGDGGKGFGGDHACLQSWAVVMESLMPAGLVYCAFKGSPMCIMGDLVVYTMACFLAG